MSKLKKKQTWTSLEHQIYSQLKALELLKKNFLLSVSGGADSMALFEVFSSLLPAEQLKVFYFHHGDNENSKHRNLALEFVQSRAQIKNIHFEFVRLESLLPKEDLQTFLSESFNESRMRKFRLQALGLILKKGESQVVATGHHEMDLLETRVLRMIRGTGPQGLPAMRPFNGLYYRPFLKLSPEELKSYLRAKKLSWLEDPSNLDVKYFRNWLRQKWLPQLELVRPGSIHRWSQSLELISQGTDQSSVLVPDGHALSRAYYLTLNQNERSLLLAKWLYKLNQTHYTQAHILEIIKQLDKSQNSFTFKIAGLVFVVNAQQIGLKIP